MISRYGLKGTIRSGATLKNAYLPAKTTGVSKCLVMSIDGIFPVWETHGSHTEMGEGYEIQDEATRMKD